MPLFHPPRASLARTTNDSIPTLDAPAEMVQRYLELAAEKRRLEDQMAFLRAELEMAASLALTEESPRGRFVAPNGQLAARLYPTATFDRAEVGDALQKMGRLAEVASIGGPSLARLLARDPQLAARLGNMVRLRKGVMLVAGER
jgi:hypothetical protein